MIAVRSRDPLEHRDILSSAERLIIEGIARSRRWESVRSPRQEGPLMRGGMFNRRNHLPIFPSQECMNLATR